MIRTTPQRGFTLLIAIILSSVVLTVGLSLLDVAYKQVVLASTAKQSQVAFYNADSALECALYYDQKFNLFDYTSGSASLPSTLKCSSAAVTDYVSTSDASKRTTVFTVPCPGGGIYATMTIYKYPGGATTLYANGYNTCTDTDPARIERGLKATYGDPTYVPVPPPSPPPSGVRTFAISPAVSGKSTWNLDTDGALTLASAGTWTITPSDSFTMSTKAWGAGATLGGAGGYAGGSIPVTSGNSITVTVGSATGGGAAGAIGGRAGAGYSGLRIASSFVLVAGGGGGKGSSGASGATGGAGGAGGGVAGTNGTPISSGAAGMGGGAGTTSGGGAGGAGYTVGGAAGSSGAGGAGGTGGGSGTAAGGGGGGGGYFGGGGGGGGYGSIGGGAGGGGGGASYASGAVTGATLTSGSGTTPGNSSDSARGTAGNPGVSGKIVIF